MFDVVVYMQDGLTAKQRFWLDHVESCASSGVTMRAYSAQHGLDIQHFYYWKKQLKALGVLSSSSEAVGQAKNFSENGLKAGRSKRSVDRRQAAGTLDQPPGPFLRASLIPAAEQPPSESEEQNSPYGARIILANGITIEVPAGIAPDALSALIHTAMQVSVAKGAPRS